MTQTPVNFQVGNTIVTTSVSTISKSPYLTKLFKEHTHYGSNVTNIFVDRDATNFQHYINYLREPDWKGPIGGMEKILESFGHRVNTISTDIKSTRRNSCYTTTIRPDCCVESFNGLSVNFTIPHGDTVVDTYLSMKCKKINGIDLCAMDMVKCITIEQDGIPTKNTPLQLHLMEIDHGPIVSDICVLRLNCPPIKRFNIVVEFNDIKNYVIESVKLLIQRCPEELPVFWMSDYNDTTQKTYTVKNAKECINYTGNGYVEELKLVLMNTNMSDFITTKNEQNKFKSLKVTSISKEGSKTLYDLDLMTIPSSRYVDHYILDIYANIDNMNINIEFEIDEFRNNTVLHVISTTWTNSDHH